MARRSQSPIEDVMDITSMLPWWAGVLLAVISYFVLHYFATQEPQTSLTINNMSQTVFSGLWRTLAFFGQIILPFAFMMGAMVSAIRRYKDKRLFQRTVSTQSDKPLNNLSWHEFELLVGKYFRMQGYAVQTTNDGPDGGIDLILTRNGETHLVQCKHWKAYKIGVKIVRELLGVMVENGATGGFVITSGEFTQDAVAFANANHIFLLNGKALIKIMKVQSNQSLSSKADNSTQPSGPKITVPKPPITTKQQPTCPKCGSDMVQRIAKQGIKAGQKFWGCSNYPSCRSVIPIK